MSTSASHLQATLQPSKSTLYFVSALCLDVAAASSTCAFPDMGVEVPIGIRKTKTEI